MATAGILNHSATSAQPLAETRVSPMANTTNTSASSSNSSASSAGISANDFLTLLVTEMKNQDPTAQTDPNQYVNQLVNVNSLEQLININQTLTNAFGSSSTGTSATGTAQAAQANRTESIAAQTGQNSSSTNASTVQPAPSTNPAADSVLQALNTRIVSGNLSAPLTNPSAQSIGHALDGHSHTQSIAGLRPAGQ